MIAEWKSDRVPYRVYSVVGVFGSVVVLMRDVQSTNGCSKRAESGISVDR